MTATMPKLLTAAEFAKLPNPPDGSRDELVSGCVATARRPAAPGPGGAAARRSAEPATGWRRSAWRCGRWPKYWPAGLRTTVNVLRRVYETGRRVSDVFKANMPIRFDDLLPNWNCRAVPQ